MYIIIFCVVRDRSLLRVIVLNFVLLRNCNSKICKRNNLRIKIIKTDVHTQRCVKLQNVFDLKHAIGNMRFVCGFVYLERRENISI